MNNEITPEQKAYLETWAGKRDLINLEISNLQVVKDKLEKENKEIANSYTDIVARMNQVIGRIDELQKKEAELPLLILKDISNLKIEKSSLESSITALKQTIEFLSNQKDGIQKDIASLVDTFVKVSGRISDLDKIVDHVTRVSSNNSNEIETVVTNLKKSLSELIDVNKKNVFETNVVIEKLPSMLVEVQKRGLIKHKI